ncbi:MAG: hypothetical protein ACNI28_01400 [Arcobacter sp.]|uniref:hypothetical protein n=1 Tax=Arcobacter sp. TaxID=1872629 RepID=UPI003B00FBBB
MKKQLLIALAISLLFIGCGGVNAPIAQKQVSKRPSLIYQPTGNQMQMKYPLNVGVLRLNDKRVLPFYSKDNFFQEEDIQGLSQLTYLELKRSGLFGSVKYINETSPVQITDEFLQQMNQKHNVDMIFIFDVTAFNLFRTKQGKAMTFALSVKDNHRDYAKGAFTMEIFSSMVGQLIYYDGGYVVWSGEVKRANKMAVTQGDISMRDLSVLTNDTLRPMFNELKTHIKTTGKRMSVQ